MRLVASPEVEQALSDNANWRPEGLLTLVCAHEADRCAPYSGPWYGMKLRILPGNTIWPLKQQAGLDTQACKLCQPLA